MNLKKAAEQNTNNSDNAGNMAILIAIVINIIN